MKTLILLLLLNIPAWASVQNSLRQDLIRATEDSDIQRLINQTEACVQEAQGEAPDLYACLAPWSDSNLSSQAKARRAEILPLVEAARSQVGSLERMAFESLRLQLESAL